MVEGNIMLLDAGTRKRSPSITRSGADRVHAEGFICAQNVKTRRVERAEPIEWVVLVLDPIKHPARCRNVLDSSEVSAKNNHCRPKQPARGSAKISG